MLFLLQHTIEVENKLCCIFLFLLLKSLDTIPGLNRSWGIIPESSGIWKLVRALERLASFAPSSLPLNCVINLVQKQNETGSQVAHWGFEQSMINHILITSSSVVQQLC